ncbi:hypothetical protein DL239_16955 [Sedimentitalea sp. CY04]|uniref:Uncharacterized protein n=1 Tax=Parasedimentitalea denitrificans TaxID=2211118 RepID=A0ABX0WAG4_9RHOB|nr:hypothetical protein [Sedimentitalea sp. CY04]NIZ62663.1 hypothetical protein [Sedimentitalea sp. CY04]
MMAAGHRAWARAQLVDAVQVCNTLEQVPLGAELHLKHVTADLSHWAAGPVPRPTGNDLRQEIGAGREFTGHSLVSHA